MLRLALMFALPLVAVPALAEDYAQGLARITAGQPPDVAAFLRHRLDCNRWLNKDPAVADVRDHLHRLKCGRIDREERAIRHRHGADKSVIDAVDEAFGMEF